MKLEDNIRKVIPYVAGEQPKDKNIIKINTNECPYPPAPGVQRLIEGLSYADLRLYPDPNVSALTEALAKRYGVDSDRVFVGVGSDDVLNVAFVTYFNSGKPILFPDVTYSFYDVWADLYGIPYKTVPLKDDWSLDVDAFCNAGEVGGIIFPNPNAPTGLAAGLSDIEKIVKAHPECVVIVDEAYVDFGAESALSLIDKYENLVVVQTFSKSRAMAGLRVGYAISNRKLIKYLEDVKFSINSYTMNRPSIELGVEAVRDEEYFRSILKRIIATREKTKNALRELGFSFPDSSANFIFASHDRIPASGIFEYLKSKGIYVRYWNKPRINNCLRITIGTDEQMDKFIETLKEMPGMQ